MPLGRHSPRGDYPFVEDLLQPQRFWPVRRVASLLSFFPAHSFQLLHAFFMAVSY